MNKKPSTGKLYTYTACLGLAVGLWGVQAPQDPKTKRDDTVERVKRAIERIAKDGDPPNQETDGGTKPEKTGPAAKTDPPAAGFSPSPEPAEIATTDGGLPEYRQLPEPNAAGGAGKSVVIIEISDIIDMGLSAFVERTIEDNADAAALIFDINTPGGRVDAATEIRDAIMNAPKSMRTVAFINPRAISAGAFISLACDLIFIADGGSIGAATPIAMGGDSQAEAVDEKMVSYFRTEMAATARAKGRRGDIAEAMVDREIAIEGVTPAGKLLTLDTAGALRLKMADAKANSVDEVLELLALGGATRRQLGLNWAEELARIFTHPILAGILMSLGVLGILIELYQPGFGLPGIVGITCLIVFFAGHLVVNLAGFEEVLIFIFGVGLLAVEIFVTPGFGILGALGVMGIMTSLVLALTALPINVSFNTGNLFDSLLRVLISLIGAGVVFIATFAFLPKLGRRNPLVLSAAIESTASGGREGEVVKTLLAVGKCGEAESFLRPAGIARFEGRRVDVTSEGEFVEKGQPVEIVRIEGNRVIVRAKS